MAGVGSQSHQSYTSRALCSPPLSDSFGEKGQENHADAPQTLAPRRLSSDRRRMLEAVRARCCQVKYGRGCERAHLDRRRRAALGPGTRDQRRQPSAGRQRRGRSQSKRVAGRRCRRPIDRARLHRYAYVHFVDGGFGLASVQLRDARTREEFVGANQGVRGNGARWHVDHGRRLGSHAVGRRAADARMDRLGYARPPGVDQPARWPHVARQQRRAETRRVSRALRQTSPAARSCAIASGEPTGVLKDNAMVLVDAVVPAPTAEMNDRALDRGDEVRRRARRDDGAQHGHVGRPCDVRARRKGETLTTRIYAAVPLADMGEAARRRGSEDIRRRRRPRRRVAARRRLERFRRRLARLAHRGVRGAVRRRAEGSRPLREPAGRSVHLDLRRRQGRPARDGARDRRSRDRACCSTSSSASRRRTARAIAASASSTRSICAERDIPRFAAAGRHREHAAVSRDRRRSLGRAVHRTKRIATTYAFRSLLDAKARLAFGSDWFVAPPTPLEGIYAAVTRRTLDDKNPDGWVPAQKITVEEALARVHDRRGVRLVR